MIQGQIGKIDQTQIIITKQPLFNYIKDGYSFFDIQRNPIFFWEPDPKPRIKKVHYYLMYNGVCMVDEITYSQLKKQLLTNDKYEN